MKMPARRRGASLRRRRAGSVLIVAFSVSVLLQGCTAVRLAVQAGPMDCRDGRGVHIACPEP